MKYSALEIELIRQKVVDPVSGFYYFFLAFWECIEASELEDNWHIRYLCEQIQVVGMQVIRKEPLIHNLIINISPNESKSTIGTAMFHPWLWVMDPSLRVITASYTEKLALDHATKSRDIITHPKFKACFGDLFSLRRDSTAKGFYKNDKGGFRAIAATKGTITGFHGHIRILVHGKV